MDGYGWNAKYLTRNGKPWFPVMGEFHYSRYDSRYWKKELQKMRSGGIDIVSSYVIWIHHEETEGSFQTEGNCNLHKFIETAKNCGLIVWLRIGPWVHGEVRNGGFPDWLLHKDCELRGNNENYFNYVKSFYEKIYKMVKGFLYKDGGPVIGIQIENEYHGTDMMSMEEQREHMKRLRAMAVNVGFKVPYYTATGWGNAATGGLLPVMGGYCEAPWDPRTTEIESSVNYIFTRERDDGKIGTDLSLSEGLDYSTEEFPFLTAELGGGVQVTKHRRPIVTGTDIGAMSMVKIGCGANLLGYYMYHGGTNPIGKHSTMQESKKTGYPNDLPELSYDFMAPLGEYGQIRESYYEIRMLSLFLHDFGEDLCEMDIVLPKDNPLSPDDRDNLRYAFRVKGDSGYLFLNNYQRKGKRKAHYCNEISLRHEACLVTFPQLKIEENEYCFYPFGMKMGKQTLVTALATPLCRLNNDNKITCVFYTDGQPQYEISGEDERYELLTISQSEARKAVKAVWDREYLLISDGLIVSGENGFIFYSKRNGQEKKQPLSCKVYPPFITIPNGLTLEREENGYGCYTIIADAVEEEALLRIYYKGESAKMYVDGSYYADNFYNGQPWEVGFLSRSICEDKENRKQIIAPYEKDSAIFFEPKIRKELEESALISGKVKQEGNEEVIIESQYNIYW